MTLQFIVEGKAIIKHENNFSATPVDFFSGGELMFNCPPLKKASGVARNFGFHV